jgi:hypothetical protein
MWPPKPWKARAPIFRPRKYDIAYLAAVEGRRGPAAYDKCTCMLIWGRHDAFAGGDLSLNWRVGGCDPVTQLEMSIVSRALHTYRCSCNNKNITIIVINNNNNRARACPNLDMYVCMS